MSGDKDKDKDMRYLIDEALERNRRAAAEPNALTRPQINPITRKPVPAKKPKENER
jgi:hypothetical protein